MMQRGAVVLACAVLAACRGAPPVAAPAGLDAVLARWDHDEHADLRAVVVQRDGERSRARWRPGSEVDAVLDLIRRFPQVAPPWKHRIDRRVAVLDRFPFTLPYQIIGNEIVVLALAHTSKRPGDWARRR